MCIAFVFIGGFFRNCVQTSLNCEDSKSVCEIGRKIMKVGDLLRHYMLP